MRPSNDFTSSFPFSHIFFSPFHSPSHPRLNGTALHGPRASHVSDVSAPPESLLPSLSSAGDWTPVQPYLSSLNLEPDIDCLIPAPGGAGMRAIWSLLLPVEKYRYLASLQPCQDPRTESTSRMSRERKGKERTRDRDDEKKTCMEMLLLHWRVLC